MKTIRFPRTQGGQKFSVRKPRKGPVRPNNSTTCRRGRKSGSRFLWGSHLVGV